MRRVPFKHFRSPSLRWTAAALLVVAVLAVSARLQPSRSPQSPIAMRYSDLLSAMAAQQVDSIVIQPGEALRGWLATPNAAGTRELRVEFGAGEGSALVKAATESRVAVAFAAARPDRSQLITLVVTLIAVALVGLVLYAQYLRQSPGSGGDFEVGTGKFTGARTTFADVAGNSAALADLREVVDFLRDSKRFVGMGAKVPKGILLEGPPGTGKTLMARALAGEAGTNFFAMSGPDFSGMFVGVGTMRVKALFRKARKAGGGVIFIDEIDSLGGRRGRTGGHPEDDRTLNQFLVELDGFSATSGIVVVAATNRASDLDPALLRKGRFDRSVTVALPSVGERTEILSLHASKRQMPLAADVEMGRMARLMPGASGADLEGLLNEAALLAVKTGASSVAWSHMEEARDRVLLGRAREGFVVSRVEQRLVALHEAGHALAGLVFCPSDPLHKVTIQPRGAAMGVAFFQPDHELHLHARHYLEGQICKALGGRAAEELIYGSAAVTSGASSDLQQATRIAKQMVYKLGMGRSTGLITFDPDSGPVSGAMHANMDTDVRAILESGYDDVLQTFREHRPALEALAKALLEHETLSGDEASAVLRAAGMTPRDVAA
ncbi:MAG: AAA family ATPase [Gemmatimonadota bacterium]